jgi:ubiquinone/menaquinone biosynthesis C-methylase UbiE
MATEQERRERLEIDFWTESETESPGARSLDVFTNKMSEARVVLEKFETYREIFGSAGQVLELGGGQGWVSCMLARTFPTIERIVTSDISPAAVASLPEWERVFDVKLSDSFACRSYDIPVGDESFDLVFAFAAAHHFGAHRRTLHELARVLKPGGHALYLHEPACRDYVYERAVKRVNRKRPVVREDLLRFRRISELAEDAGLHVQLITAPTTTFRAPLETIYYLALQKVPPLRSLLPCSVDFIFTKNAR